MVILDGGSGGVQLKGGSGGINMGTANTGGVNVNITGGINLRNNDDNGVQISSTGGGVNLTEGGDGGGINLVATSDGLQLIGTSAQRTTPTDVASIVALLQGYGLSA